MSMNCRSCHFVDEFVDAQGNNMRTYTDFVSRSPIPSRPDGKATAPRNTPPLVNASLDRPGGTLFHFDGEFSTLEDLIVGTFTGRNFGWLPGQKAEAIHYILHKSCGATTAPETSPSNSTDFPIENYSPEPAQTFRMNSV